MIVIGSYISFNLADTVDRNDNNGYISGSQKHSFYAGMIGGGLAVLGGCIGLVFLGFYRYFYGKESEGEEGLVVRKADGHLGIKAVEGVEHVFGYNVTENHLLRLFPLQTPPQFGRSRSWFCLI